MNKNILLYVDKKGEEHDYNHIIALLRFEDDDNYVLKNIIINEKYNININIGKEIHYPYRS